MKRLTRSESDATLGGVCGGIAEYFNIDPTFVRIGAVVLAIMTGFFPFVIGYFIAVFIIPRKTTMKTVIEEIKKEIKEGVESEKN